MFPEAKPQPRSQGLSSYRRLERIVRSGGGKMRDPGNEVGEVEENIEVEGKQNSLFPAGPVMKCFVYLPTQKKEKETTKKLFA